MSKGANSAPKLFHLSYISNVTCRLQLLYWIPENTKSQSSVSSEKIVMVLLAKFCQDRQWSSRLFQSWKSNSSFSWMSGTVVVILQNKNREHTSCILPVNRDISFLWNEWFHLEDINCSVTFKHDYTVYPFANWNQYIIW